MQRNLIFDSFKAPHSQSTLSLHFFQKGFSFTGPTIVAVRAIFWADTCTSQEKLNQFYPISSRNCSTCMYNVLVRKMKFLEHQWSSCYISLKCIQQDREHFRMLCRYPSCLPSPCSLSVSWWRSNPVFFLQTFIPCKVMRFSFEFHLKIIFVPQLFAIEPGETWERWNILSSETWEVLDWSHLSVNQSPRGMAMKEWRTDFFVPRVEILGGVLKFRWEWKILLFFCMAFCWQFETRVAQGWRSRWLRFQRQVWSLSIAFYFGDIRAFRMAYRAVCVSSAHAGENFNSTGSFVLGFIMRECLMNVKSPPLVTEQNLRSKGNSSKMLCRFVNYVSLPRFHWKTWNNSCFPNYTRKSVQNNIRLDTLLIGSQLPGSCHTISLGGFIAKSQSLERPKN